MTTTSVVTSPLQAAREWRGIALVVAARNSGLSLGQAQALEEGRSDAFDSIEEMVAASVVYASSLGIGRDEAMALLDRTIAGDEFPLPPERVPNPRGSASGGLSVFSQAVQHRSAARAAALTGSAAGVGHSLEPTAFTNVPNPPGAGDQPRQEDRLPDEEVSDAGETGEIPLPAGMAGFADEDAALPLQSPLGGSYADGPPWDEDGIGPDLWEAGRGASVSAPSGPGAAERLSARLDALTVRALGHERSRRWFEQRARAIAVAREAVTDAREHLRRSEHATLIVAVGAGVVLIALVIALGSALGGEEARTAGAPKEKSAPNAVSVPAGSEAAGTAPAAAQPEEVAAPKKRPAVLPPAQVRLQVLNAGSRKGYAHEVAGRLRSLGYTVEKVGNSKSSYGTSVVLYPKRFQREAKRLGRQAGITTLDTYPGNPTVPAMTIVVV